ncbi:MAG: outer membrane protein assembly complex, YaeT protein/outer membrane protein assembly factor BamA [Treponematales bacterium]
MRFFCLFVLLAFCAFPAAGQDTGASRPEEPENWYQGKPIRDVVFEGLVHVSASELEGITSPYRGKPFDDDTYWEILGRLYALEYFDLITPATERAGAGGNEVVLRFTVKEKPIVSRIDLAGNSGLRRSELLEVITIKTGDVVSAMKLQADEQAITAKYLEKGYPDVKVTAGTTPGAKDSLVVTFTITEGEKITIETIRFEGNNEQQFPSKLLKRQLSLSEKGFLKDGAFQEAKLIADTAALAQYYRDRGYLDAGVLDVVRETRKDEKGGNFLTLTFRLTEGQRYTFGGVTFEGNRIFSTEQLSALVYSKEGETANDRRIQADLMRVSDLYYENGYLFNRIEPRAQKESARGVISYHIVIQEYERAHIENIIVRGNVKTKNEVILREMPLEVGAVFSKAKVLEGMRNLYNLQFFSSVAPEPVQGSAESLMDLIINVEEQPTTQIMGGLTFSGTSDPDTFPVSLFLQLNDLNFRGTGNSVGVEVNASPDTQSVSLSHTRRWLFGLPLNGTFDLTGQHAQRKGLMDNIAPYFNGDEDYAFPDGFVSYDDWDADSDGLPSTEFLMPYEQWRVSLGASTGYRFLTPAGNLSVGGGLRVGAIFTQYDENLFRPFDPVLRSEDGHWTPQTSLWASVSLDQRDIYYDPSKGYYGVQRLGFYGIFPPEEEHYVRSDTKAEIFFTLFRIPVSDTFTFKAVFGAHTGLSLLLKQPFQDAAVVQSSSKLAVDGMFYGRGWTSEYSTKGLALWENWAEVRIPVAPGILAWDFFFDAAEIADSPERVFSGDSRGSLAERMRFSFGGGLRFTMPQFPFRFLFAKRFKIADGEVAWQPGALGGDGSGASGIDFVISFALSSY